MTGKRLEPAGTALAVGLLLLLGAVLLTSGDAVHACLFLLFYIWPTFTWLPLLPGRGAVPLVSAAGLALLAGGLLTLLLNAWPGALPSGVWLGAGVFWGVLPLLWPGWHRPDWPWLDREHRLAVIGVTLLLLLAAYFRFADLGYKEIQGDEGVALVRAASALQGNGAILFQHQKGPLEILLPLRSWGAAGTIDDFWTRLPFAWAGWLAVAALLLLAWRWGGPVAGVSAGLLLAINGFAVAFSRIVQYQSLVLLLGGLALLQADVYRRQRQRTALWLTALFLAGGLLAHYDAVLVTPALVWLLWPAWRRPDRDWRAWLGAVLLGGVALALFYVPFVLNPNFAATLDYLLSDRLGGGDSSQVIGWSGARVWQMLTFYNSTYYIIGLGLLLAAGLVVVARQRRWGPAAAWFLAPALFYSIIVADPRTHVYTLFPGAAVLAGLAVGAAGERLGRGAGRRLGAGLLLVWLLLSAGYVYLIFVDHTPERQRTWAENRPVLYPTTWSEPPLYGLFGFPHQAGWRAAAAWLPADAVYASNEEEEITNWYMAQAPRTHCADFDVFYLAADVQDAVPYDPAWLDGFVVTQEITVNGRPTLRVYQRGAAAETVRVAADTARRWLAPAAVAPPRFTGRNPIDVVLGDDQVRLLGYDISATTIRPGETLVVTLYWEALAPFAANYQTFVHLYDGSMIAQHDGAPECGVNPTTRWEPGQIIPDPHLVAIPADAPAGSLPILVGMYDLLTVTRLVVPDRPEGTIHLSDVQVAP